MGAFEKAHILSEHMYNSNIIFYRRFINDLFFIWQRTRDDALDFMRILNNNNWGLKFTVNFSDTNLEFLDFMVSVEEGRFTTSSFFKQVDNNSYLSYDSGHLKKWKLNIPFGQYQRRGNCTKEETYVDQAKILQQRFKEKKYHAGIIKQAYQRAKKLSQKECLENKKKILKGNKDNNNINFITTYNVQYNRIRGTLSK